MNKPILGSLLSAFVVLWAAAEPLCSSPSLQEQEISKEFVLDNGLQVVLYEKRGVPLINITVAVNAGTKDETKGTNGLVHLLEHCILFRGTEFRSGIEVSRDIRKNGAYFNASTGQDLAAFDISLPSDRGDFGLNNQKEILFNFDISQEELDREKDVVLSELALIQDDPKKVAMSFVFQNLFAGHPYQTPVYGCDADIRAIGVETLQSFYKAYFVPANCSLAVVGDFRIVEMEEKVRRIFGPVPGRPFKPVSFEKARLLDKAVNIRNEMDIKETYLVIGLAGPDYNSPDQYAVDLLTEILGRGVNPLIISGLRTRGDLVQTVTMSYMPLKYGGVITAVFTLDAKYIRTAAGEAVKFLRNVRNLNFSKDDYSASDERYYALDFLKSAKNQLLFNSQLAQESGLRMANSLARHILLDDKKNERMSYWDRMDRLSSTDLRRAAAKYLSKGDGVIVSIRPKK